jgi:lipopolysaccharide transport system ATP-binding protein
MKKNIAIKLTDITKKYVLHHQKPTLVENIIRREKKVEFQALKRINLEIPKGAKVGLIGGNGSGKTTLLKIIAGITSPTTGKVEINGKIAALVDLAAGFHSELTGEENVYLNGMLLGMSKNEIKSKFDKIIAFSGLKKFIDVPLFTYSSGMTLRLGFSVAIFANPDILLIDEVLAVGDEEFKKKSYGAIEKLFNEGKTVLYVSHSLDTVEDLTDMTVWLTKGHLEQVGSTSRIINKYTKLKF